MFRFALLALLMLGAGGAGVPVVATNAQLGFLPSYQASAVLRLGVFAPGDAPPQWFVPTTGASNNYVITGNICGGAAQVTGGVCVVDGGSGANKTVSGNW